MASTMGASFRVELKKMYKRPAVWAIGLIFLILIVLFGYMLNYLILVIANGDSSSQAQGGTTSLYPKHFVSAVLVEFSGGFVAALTLALGAISVGSEYGWQTYKLILTQRPSRLSFLVGKLLAVGTVLAMLTIAGFLVGLTSSYVIAALQGGSTSLPAFGQILEGLGAGWLVLVTFASMGFFLATLFRGNALAIAFGLVYLLVVEGLFLQLISFQNDTVANIGKALPVRNAGDLVYSIGSSPQAAQASNLPQGLKPVDPLQATLVLGAYVVVFLALSILLFRRRDVT